VPLHGPKFRLLQPQEKQELIKLHKNLGHPDPNVLSQHLKTAGASEQVVEAAKEYICDACVEPLGLAIKGLPNSMSPRNLMNFWGLMVSSGREKRVFKS
jgi:hypothetical protein